MLPLLIPLCLDPLSALARWSDPQPPPPPPADAPSALGLIDLSADTFPVHEQVMVELVYTAPLELRPGDTIRVEEPLFHGMRWAKWGYLTTDITRCTGLSETEEASVGAIRASTSNGAEIFLYHATENSDIHAYGYVDVELGKGGLPAGETLTIRMGIIDTDIDCGWQTSNRAFQSVPIRAYEMLGQAKEPVLIQPVPTLSFSPWDEVEAVRAIAPSQAVVGEAVPIRVVGLDRWGNVAGEGGVEVQEAVFDSPGVHRVEVEAYGETVTSNPIRVTEEEAPLKVYWGDLHTHHGHSYDDDEGDWVNANHDYARDVMGLDYASESVKTAPYELDYENVWAIQQRACREFTVDGEYIALLGFEWMGDQAQGHHNVYVDGCEAPQGSFGWLDIAEDMWPFMEDVEAQYGYSVVSIPHASAFTGFNWKVRDDRLRPVAEVYSEWDSSMDEALNGSVPDGLRSGNRLGLIAASDNHDGWLGNTLAVKDAPGGIGAIVASELTATALLEGMQAHRTIATTGERILVDVEVEAGGEVYPVGSDVPGGDARLRWSAHGTDAIERVAVRMTAIPARDQTADWGAWSPGALDAEGEIELPWGAHTVVVWLEVTQADGEKAWSSPLWINPPELPPSDGGCAAAGAGVGGWWWLGALALGWRRRIA